MKVVGTKLDKRDHEQLLEMCNAEGQTIAEALRGMIQDYCDAWKNGEETEESNEEETPKPTLTPINEDNPDNIRIFECNDGKLYENGNYFGECSEQLSNGIVYDKNSNPIGMTKGRFNNLKESKQNQTATSKIKAVVID